MFAVDDCRAAVCVGPAASSRFAGCAPAFFLAGARFEHFPFFLAGVFFMGFALVVGGAAVSSSVICGGIEPSVGLEAGWAAVSWPGLCLGLASLTASVTVIQADFTVLDLAFRVADGFLSGLSLAREVTDRLTSAALGITTVSSTVVAFAVVSITRVLLGRRRAMKLSSPTPRAAGLALKSRAEGGTRALRFTLLDFVLVSSTANTSVATVLAVGTSACPGASSVAGTAAVPFRSSKRLVVAASTVMATFPASEGSDLTSECSVASSSEEITVFLRFVGRSVSADLLDVSGGVGKSKAKPNVAVMFLGLLEVNKSVPIVCATLAHTLRLAAA